MWQWRKAVIDENRPSGVDSVSSFVYLLWGVTAPDCTETLSSFPRDGLFVLLILSRMARVWKNVKPHLSPLYLRVKVIKVKTPLHEKNRLCYQLGWDLGTAKAGSQILQLSVLSAEHRWLCKQKHGMQIFNKAFFKLTGGMQSASGCLEPSAWVTICCLH